VIFNNSKQKIIQLEVTEDHQRVKENAYFILGFKRTLGTGSATDVKHLQIHKALTSAELTSGLESTEAESGLYSALEPQRT